MKKVALVIDNSGYLSEEEKQKLNIVKEVPISFIVNDEEYYEGVNMSYTQFHKFLKDKNTTVSTSQPSLEIVKDAWRAVLKNYDEIVYMLLSSGLSEACNSALNASHEEEFEGKVFVVNNGRVSYMQKFQIYQASELIKQGKNAKEIKDYLEDCKLEAAAYIAVDTLKYLKKGGRITPAAAAIGTLLNIKPILQVRSGKLDSFAKCMSMKQARIKMIQATRKEVEEKFADEAKKGHVYIAIAHAQTDLNTPELEDFVKEVKQAFADFPFFHTDPLPLFVQCHTGPGALACGYAVDRLGVIKDMI